MQHPILAVVKDGADEVVPVEQLRAEVMLSVAAVMRSQAARLPADDALAAELVEWARGYCAAATISWPPCAAVVLAAQSQTG